MLLRSLSELEREIGEISHLTTYGPSPRNVLTYDPDDALLKVPIFP